MVTPNSRSEQATKEKEAPIHIPVQVNRRIIQREREREREGGGRGCRRKRRTDARKGGKDRKRKEDDESGPT